MAGRLRRGRLVRPLRRLEGSRRWVFVEIARAVTRARVATAAIRRAAKVRLHSGAGTARLWRTRTRLLRSERRRRVKRPGRRALDGRLGDVLRDFP